MPISSPSTAPRPSWVQLPHRQPPPSLLDFLTDRFPRIGRETWRKRILDGKVRDQTGTPLSLGSPYRGGTRIQYFREVEAEARVPFSEQILRQTDDLLVADKPHFLPVVPGGRYVNECLLYRLIQRTGIEELTPIHRLDLDTAGLVLFSTRRQSRGAYGNLFKRGEIERTYLAVGRSLSGDAPAQERWRVESRIEAAEPWFLSRSVIQRTTNAVNAVTEIELIEWRKESSCGLFRLRPHTGKNHQLRLHMTDIGFPVLHDTFYPQLQPEEARSYERPLQLLAQRLEFTDPLSGQAMHLASQRQLASLAHHPRGHAP